MDDQDLKDTVAERWSENIAGSDAFSADVYWLAVPAVQARHQRRACGGAIGKSWVQYCLDFMSALPAARMLSIGCGSGTLERDLYRLRAFVHCDGVDIAAGAIDVAVREAAALGASSIHYQVLDVERAELPAATYDAIWFNGSLHHIDKLERVCKQVRQALKPGGWLFLNEYVGANRFAFDATQADAVRHSFALIPRQMRRSFCQGSFGQVQEIVPLPDPREVARVDPSEAVRSQDILPVLGEHFDFKAHNRTGGSLLQFALHGIAGNFREERPDSMRILQMLFDIEDGLIDSGSLASDFVVVAAQAKTAAANKAQMQ